MTPRAAAELDAARLRPGWQDAVLCTVAVALVWIVYANALHNPFVYDDHRTIVDNGSIRDVSRLTSIVMHEVTRPLVNLSYAVDLALWGPEPFGFHFTSVLLHSLNVLLLFFVASKVASDADAGRSRESSPRLIASAAAALFAVHPLMTSAVGYISARSEVLCATILLLAFSSGRRWIRGGGAMWGLVTLALWIASVLAREVTAVFPILLLAYDRIVLDSSAEEKRRRFWKLHTPLIALSLAAAAVRFVVFAVVEHPNEVGLRWSAILEQSIVSWRYIALLVVLNGQAIYHHIRPVLSLWDATGLFAFAALAGVLASAWFAKSLDPLIRLGVVWFFVLLAPSSLLAILGFGEGMTEHRVYVASCGIFLVAGSSLDQMRAVMSGSKFSRALVYAVIVAGVLSLGTRAALRNLMWQDPAVLWQEASMLAPDDAFPQTVLAEELQRTGRYHEAVPAFETALRLNPEKAGTYLNLGVTLAALQRFDEANATFERLRGVAPESTVVPTGLGAVAMLSGQPEVARVQFMEALRRDPHDVLALQWLALLEEESAGDPEAALRRCEEIQSLSPGKLSNEDCIRRNRARLSGRTNQP